MYVVKYQSHFLKKYLYSKNAPLHFEQTESFNITCQTFHFNARNAYRRRRKKSFESHTKQCTKQLFHSIFHIFILLNFFRHSQTFVKKIEIGEEKKASVYHLHLHLCNRTRNRDLENLWRIKSMCVCVCVCKSKCRICYYPLHSRLHVIC